MRKMWPLLAALVVLTSACRLETNVIIDVNDDGSGTITTELGLDEEMQNLLESFGGGEDLLSGLDLGDGTTPTETRVEGDMTFFSASRSFTDPSEVQALLDANQDQASFEDFQLSVDDNGAVLVARTGPLGDQQGIDPGSLPIDLNSIADDNFSANIFVDMPGNVTEHNADQVMPDGRLRWGISLTDPLDISAESSFGGGGVPWLPIGIAALAILGVGAFVVMRNREDPATTALAGTEVPPAPMDFADPATRATEAAGGPVGELPPELPPQS